MADFDHGFAGIGSSFVVLAVATAAAVPRITAFHYPAYADGTKTFCSGGRLLHFDAPTGTLEVHPSVQALIVVFVVAEDHLHSRKAIDIHAFDDSGCCSTVVQVGCGDYNCDQQPEHIDQYMTLSTLDFLASVVTSFLSSDLSGLG